MDTSGLGEHRIRLRYETNGPLQLDSVADAFAALEAQYVEALRRRGYKPGGGTAKLYVTELRSGSLEAEIAAAAVVLGAAVQAMDVSLVIHDFSQRLRSLLAWFAGRSDERPPMERRDVDHVCQLLEVVKDRPDAAMLLQQSRIVQRENGLEKETLLELGLDRKGIERAQGYRAWLRPSRPRAGRVRCQGGGSRPLRPQCALLLAHGQRCPTPERKAQPRSRHYRGNLAA